MTSSKNAASPRRSPWLAVDPTVDPVQLAKLLHRAHRLSLVQDRTPPFLRSIVARSWDRARAEGVDPDGCAPTVYDEAETARALGAHPVASHIPLIKKLLSEAIDDGEYFVALSDADGNLLWSDGHSKALELAIPAGFLPGHLCSEAAVGTNAVGAALVLDHPIQIFSAEHFNRRLHALTCAAAPVRDPESRTTTGVLNISGNFRHGHPHSLPLISAVARVVEGALAEELRLRDDRMRADYIDLVSSRPIGHSALVTPGGRVLAASPRGWLGSWVGVGTDGELVLPNGFTADDELLGSNYRGVVICASRSQRKSLPTLAVEAFRPGRIRLSIGKSMFHLSHRHSQLLALLALNKDGLSGAELGRLIYPEDNFSPVTVRAEIARLRRLLGSIVASNPYRLEAFVEADPELLRSLISRPTGRG